MLPNTIVTTLTAVPRSSGICVESPIVAGALPEPAAEDGADREVELLPRLRGKGSPVFS